MKKVFYSVRYTELALCKKSCTMWFDNLEEAKEFAKADYRDNLLSTCTAVKQQ